MIDENGKPVALAWTFTRAELVADGVVHALGVACAAIGAALLLVLCLEADRALAIAAAGVYGACLMGALGISAAYNMWPVSRTKWLLRRFDHAAIYLLIAGTYTPVLLHLPPSALSLGLLGAVWLAALAGMVVKLRFPGRFDRTAVALYLALGWSGMVAIEPVVAGLPAAALWLVALGGVIYSLGVIFHLWRGLRFQNAIWHGFVLVAAACHYAAIVDMLMA